VANRDPVLAGRLVQTANAALFARRSRVRSVAEAVAFIGADTTRKVLMALALEPMFLSAKLHSLWRHSLWAAQFCEGVARATGFMLPDDAMLLGLVHDIGSVSVQSQRRDILCKAARLSDRGCPAVYVERLLLGKDHGEIGAQILASWDFDDELIEAVRYHHQPADTDLAAASVLHVAEFWAETGEDMCSIRHLSLALSNTGCSNEILARAERFQGSLSDLLRVA
jgi:putative nucleotidyltransferase with HDIG domain